MGRWQLSAVLLVLGGSAVSSYGWRTPRSGDELAPEPPAPAAAPDPSPGPDLSWARALNDAKYPISRDWRRGTVSPLALAPERVTLGTDRFEVRFPSGAPISTPAVHAGRVFVSGGFHGKEFYAVDAKSGAPAWGRGLDDDGPSAPACADSVCVFNTESCTVFALSAASGELLWAWWMGDPMLSAPAIGGDLVFTSYPLATGEHHPDASHVLAALELHTGAVRWLRWIDGDIVSSPVLDGDRVLATTFSGSLFTFARADGALVAATRGRATSAPTAVGGKVFYSSRTEASGEGAKEGLVRADEAGRREATTAEKRAPYLDAKVQDLSAYFAQGQALDASNGFGGGAPSTAKGDVAKAIVGRDTVAGLQAFQGSRVATDGTHNYAAMGDEIVAADAKTGAERWRVKVGGDLAAGGALVASPALAGGRLVVGTLRGTVQILDAKTGRILREIPIGGPIRSQVVVEDGWVYAGTEDGRLVGVDTGDRTLTGWTMWGGDAGRTASR